LGKIFLVEGGEEQPEGLGIVVPLVELILFHEPALLFDGTE
jgi:hypothetical protein